jgi:D-hydroxyproline dehydrogenase subunit alpha
MNIVVVGAGPAGTAAAIRARECGAEVTILDDNQAAGGQIWRNETHGDWFTRFAASGAELITGARVISCDSARRTLRAEIESSAVDIRYDNLILATGARELLLPFPGWTLPNVMGVGGLQALVKSGFPVEGKRVVVAGSGPLLLAVASYLKARGAEVPVIAEQAGWNRLFRFTTALLRQPGKIAQAIALRSAAYSPGSWVLSADGRDKVESVRLHLGGKTLTEQCDYLAVAFGFSPNTELASLIGCSLNDDGVEVDAFQRTSQQTIYSAGETTGIGGVELSLVEGEIAGLAAAGRESEARRLFPSRAVSQRFAAALSRTFALRSELKNLPNLETIICRCEDVTLERLRDSSSWRAAKLHARCGMGPCQGRVCGPAVKFLFGWNAESVRPPVFPARVSSLIEENTTT